MVTIYFPIKIVPMCLFWSVQTLAGLKVRLTEPRIYCQQTADSPWAPISPLNL
jgi:hypothetical protein